MGLMLEILSPPAALKVFIMHYSASIFTNVRTGPSWCVRFTALQKIQKVGTERRDA